MDTYVLIGENQYYNNTKTFIDYAGDDKEEAFTVENEQVYDSIRLQVFRSGTRIQEFKRNNGEWEETFNLINNINDKIKYHGKQLDAYRKELENLN